MHLYGNIFRKKKEEGKKEESSILSNAFMFRTSVFYAIINDKI